MAVVLLVAVLLTVVNMQFTRNFGGGDDFRTLYFSTHAYIQGENNPYSESTSKGAQLATYGRPAEAGERNLRFTSPLFTIFIVAPFALIPDFATARALWMTVLEFALIAIILLSFQLTYWKAKPLVWIALILFCVFGFNGILAVFDGSVSGLAAITVLGVVISIRDQKDEVAGLLLAIATFAPLVTILFVLFIIFWALFNRRYGLLAWFGGALAILFGFSFALMPDWLFLFFRNLSLLFQEILIGSPGDALANHWGAAGGRLAIILTVLLGLLLAFEWWQARRSPMKHFVWTAMLTLVVSQWIGIKTSPSNFVILYPALIVGLHFLWERWDQRALGSILLILAVLFGVSWLLLLTSGHPALTPPISALLMIPLPLFSFVLLYWSRWWVSRSQKIQIEPTLVTLQKP